MGRAIEMEKRLDTLEFKVNEILLMLDELANTNTTQEHIDLHEETKEEKANDEGNGKSGGKSNKRKSTAKSKSNKDTGSSK
jgi:transposase-like protein